MRDEIAATVGAATAKTAPPVAVASAIASGLSVDRAVVWLTAMYVAAQLGYLLWRWAREWAQGRKRDDGKD